MARTVAKAQVVELGGPHCRPRDAGAAAMTRSAASFIRSSRTSCRSIALSIGDPVGSDDRDVDEVARSGGAAPPAPAWSPCHRRPLGPRQGAQRPRRRPAPPVAASPPARSVATCSIIGPAALARLPRVRTRTRRPSAARRATTCRPSLPVPPVTTISGASRVGTVLSLMILPVTFACESGSIS